MPPIQTNSLTSTSLSIQSYLKILSTITKICRNISQTIRTTMRTHTPMATKMVSMDTRAQCIMISIIKTNTTGMLMNMTFPLTISTNICGLTHRPQLQKRNTSLNTTGSQTITTSQKLNMSSVNILKNGMLMKYTS